MKTLKKILIAIVSLIAVLLLTSGIFYATLNPYRGTNKKSFTTLPLEQKISGAQAKEDIDFIMKMLRTRHPAWIETGNEKVLNVEAKYIEESSKIGSEVSVLDEWIAVSHILHELYDGHTTVHNRNPNQRYISDFAQIQSGATLSKINGVPAKSIYENFLSVYQYERTDFAKSIFTSKILCSEDYLRWCGVDVSDGVTFTFESMEGSGDFHYDFVPIDQVKNLKMQEAGKWVYYEIDKEKSTGIFTLTTCNFNKEYKDTVKKFFEEVAENKIQNVIVDLRSNGGGNSLVGDEFLRYLDIDGYYSWANEIRVGNFLIRNKRSFCKNNKLKPSFAGNIFVLTDTRTYSSAMDFTMYICDNKLGKIIGEASGNLPSSYGDCLNFITPNSRLAFSVSYKHWHRIDESKESEPLNPDYPCDPKDALKEAYKLIEKNTSKSPAPDAGPQ